MNKIKEYLKKHELSIYKLLGAEYFQKIVFLVEKIKYGLMEKFLPNASSNYEKNLKRKYERMIEKGRIKEEDKKRVKLDYQMQKMVFRKELLNRQNRNYHYDTKYPLQFIEYLKLNRYIHLKGLAFNLGALLAIIVSIIFIPTLDLSLFIPITIYEVINLIVNFECINLQNYNLCRFKEERLYRVLERRQNHSIETAVKKYANCSEKVYDLVIENDDIPTVQEVADCVTSSVEVEELLDVAKKQLAKVQKNDKILGKKLRREN